MGQVVIGTAMFMILALNGVFASNNPIDSIKMSYNECFMRCSRGCFGTPINAGCLMGCRMACRDCRPSCKAQRFPSSSDNCNVGCSLTKCAKITDSYKLLSCIGDCSDIYCKKA